ncbi:hypothetical protein [Pseudooceanicola algae]|uniref:Uncharacterized protein n=1 Tax=Pseudooceanicola algae TaxID=1537215 RepID=A0A418SDL9_9RHOB|nr:hypothetical protein [Pseudooceanicola algae]QPM89364.1 hypothetical protein PSAL_005800 [Pseudooceanicola algae]
MATPTVEMTHAEAITYLNKQVVELNLALRAQHQINYTALVGVLAVSTPEMREAIMADLNTAVTRQDEGSYARQSLASLVSLLEPVARGESGGHLRLVPPVPEE